MSVVYIRIMKTKIRKLIEGLELFESAGTFEVSVNSRLCDSILAGDPDSVTPEQKKHLRDLGWYEYPQYECFRFGVD